MIIFHYSLLPTSLNWVVGGQGVAQGFCPAGRLELHTSLPRLQSGTVPTSARLLSYWAGLAESLTNLLSPAGPPVVSEEWCMGGFAGCSAGWLDCKLDWRTGRLASMQGGWP